MEGYEEVLPPRNAGIQKQGKGKRPITQREKAANRAKAAVEELDRAMQSLRGGSESAIQVDLPQSNTVFQIPSSGSRAYSGKSKKGQRGVLNRQFSPKDYKYTDVTNPAHIVNDTIPRSPPGTFQSTKTAADQADYFRIAKHNVDALSKMAKQRAVDRRQILAQRGWNSAPSYFSKKVIKQRLGVTNVTPKATVMLRLLGPVETDNFVLWHKQHYGDKPSISQNEVFAFLDQELNNPEVHSKILKELADHPQGWKYEAPARKEHTPSQTTPWRQAYRAQNPGKAKRGRNPAFLY